VASVFAGEDMHLIVSVPGLLGKGIRWNVCEGIRLCMVMESV
jgi:hypothetical protein